ncbi:MAG: ATP-dependent DNA ligase [Candidatus Njordarchaeia archaeon]
MLFEKLCEYYEKLEILSGKIEMTKVLADLFRNSDPNEIDKVVYLTWGKLRPDYEEFPELGIAEKLALRAISQAAGLPLKQVERLYKDVGDIGKAAEEAIKKKKTATLVFQPLTVSDVYDKLLKIAQASGAGSQDLKLRILMGMLVVAKPIEARYLMRTVIGKMRLGIGEMTILDALAEAFLGDRTKREPIEKAFNRRPDLGFIAKTIAKEGLDGILKVKVTPGIPIRPMLAERLSDPKEILEKAGGKVLAEYKYDGERAQIHKMGERVMIFSRRLENITSQYPDVVEAAKKDIDAKEAIVEGEIVAIDPETGDMRPFQELMRRKRKYDIKKMMEEIPVKVFLFDAIYVDGKELLELNQLERRKILEKIIKPSDVLTIATHLITDNVEDLEKFFYKAIDDGCEGLVVKSISEEAVYQAGARGWLWIKYKREYKSEMTDTVDLVVIGAFKGTGRRAGTYGALLLAAYNDEDDVFESVCKVGTGFTDADLAEIPIKLKEHVTEVKPKNVVSDMEPDVWVEPKFVMEVLGAEITLSPVHVAGKKIIKEKLKKDAGVAIRFPRFIRWRDDKSPYDATTSKELVEMYFAQLKKEE